MIDYITILAGAMVDGENGIRRNMLLAVREGKIWRIETHDGDRSNVVIDVDLSEYTLIPGLVDAHVHLFMSGTDDKAIRENQLDAEYEDIRDVIGEHILNALSYGVTAIRDGGDKNKHAIRYRDQDWDGCRLPIRLKLAGKAWRKPERYGKLIAGTPGENESLAEAITNIKDGIDHVKIVNSGLNSLKVFGKETPPQFNLEELMQAKAAAKKRGLGLMVHANGQLPVQIAVDAGCDSIEHGFFMGAENLAKMAEKGITWVPTAITMKAYSQYLASEGGVESEIAKRNLDAQLEQIRLARQYGTPVALGTDAGSLGVFHGRSVIEEMKLFMEAGMSLEETIKCVTINGLRLLGMDGGVFKPGAEATFIAVKGDPEGLPGSLESERLVFIDGFSVGEADSHS